jgi:hypothetical protein
MTTRSKATEATAVKVGDRIELEGPNSLAVLPDGSVVTCRNGYTVQHEGRHVIGGTEYNATKPTPKAQPAPAEDPKD